MRSSILTLLFLMGIPNLSSAQVSGTMDTRSIDLGVTFTGSPVEVQISQLQDFEFDFEPIQPGDVGFREITRDICVYASQPLLEVAVTLVGTVLTDGHTDYKYIAALDAKSGNYTIQSGVTLDPDNPTIPVAASGFTVNYEGENCPGSKPFTLLVHVFDNLSTETVGTATATLTITVAPL